jgi:hypothetical protein
MEEFTYVAKDIEGLKKLLKHMLLYPKEVRQIYKK